MMGIEVWAVIVMAFVALIGLLTGFVVAYASFRSRIDTIANEQKRLHGEHMKIETNLNDLRKDVQAVRDSTDQKLSQLSEKMNEFLQMYASDRTVLHELKKNFEK